MNAISKTASPPEGACISNEAKAKEEARIEALCHSQQLVRDWDRLHSIIMFMENAVLAETGKVEAKGDMVESWVAEAFTRNVSWLMDQMEGGVTSVRDCLIAAGYDMGSRI